MIAKLIYHRVFSLSGSQFLTCQKAHFPSPVSSLGMFFSLDAHPNHRLYPQRGSTTFRWGWPSQFHEMERSSCPCFRIQGILADKRELILIDGRTLQHTNP